MRLPPAPAPAIGRSRRPPALRPLRDPTDRQAFQQDEPSARNAITLGRPASFPFLEDVVSTFRKLLEVLLFTVVAIPDRCPVASRGRVEGLAVYEALPNPDRLTAGQHESWPPAADVSTAIAGGATITQDDRSA